MIQIAHTHTHTFFPDEVEWSVGERIESIDSIRRELTGASNLDSESASPKAG